MIRSALPSDAVSICEIYNHYILESHATCETSPVSSKEMAKRISRIQQELNLPWIVLEVDQQVVGYAYATQWKPRQAYAKTVETTVYIHMNFHGQGFGKRLYLELIDSLRNLGYHALLGGISLPNEGSAVLHEKVGFKKVGQLQQVGYKFDRWIDVGYWELIL